TDQGEFVPPAGAQHPCPSTPLDGCNTATFTFSSTPVIVPPTASLHWPGTSDFPSALVIEKSVSRVPVTSHGEAAFSPKRCSSSVAAVVICPGLTSIPTVTSATSGLGFETLFTALISVKPRYCCVNRSAV